MIVSVSLFYQRRACESGALESILSQSGGTVSIVLAVLQVFQIVVLELLFEREIVEFPSKSELVIDFFLADAEVLYVEEANMLSCIGELLGKLFFSTRGVEQAQVERDELRPVDCLFVSDRKAWLG